MDLLPDLNLSWLRVVLSQLFCLAQALPRIWALTAYIAIPLRITGHILLPPIRLSWSLIVFLWSPMIEVVLFIASWLDLLLTFVAALKPLYTFFGVAALIGFVAGTTCFAVSCTLENVLGLNSLDAPAVPAAILPRDPSLLQFPSKDVSQRALIRQQHHRRAITATPQRNELPSFTIPPSPVVQSPAHPLSPPASPVHKTSSSSSVLTTSTLENTTKPARVRARVGEKQRLRLARLHSLQQQARQNKPPALASGMKLISQTIVEDTEAEARSSS
ncbi:hypothetical protein BROUX41_001681 [Berkeleyomyces rouxiae]